MVDIEVDIFDIFDRHNYFYINYKCCNKIFNVFWLILH